MELLGPIQGPATPGWSPWGWPARVAKCLHFMRKQSASGDPVRHVGCWGIPPLILPHIDIEILKPLVLRIAQGFACKDSAAAADVSPETIRARRKRLYRKVGACGSSDVTARLLGLSLAMIAAGERLEAPKPALAAFAPAPVQILQAAL